MAVGSLHSAGAFVVAVGTAAFLAASLVSYEGAIPGRGELARLVVWAVPTAVAWAVYGAYDLSGTPSARNWARNLILSREVLEWFGDNLLPGVDREARRDPEISPLYADLRDMPPALFQVGTLDPLLDDSLFMYSRWIAAGNQAELAIYPGAIHGFVSFPYALARRANAHINEFLASAVRY